MALPAAIPSIRPISDLRTKLSELEQLAKETGEPIIMTKNGAPSLVLMDSEAYNASLQHMRAVRKLREAEIEARYNPGTVSFEEANQRFESILSKAEKAHRQRN